MPALPLYPRIRTPYPNHRIRITVFESPHPNHRIRSDARAPTHSQAIQQEEAR